MSDIDREMIQVVTLDKDDILVFDVGRLPSQQTEVWLRGYQRILKYQHESPCLMPLRQGQGLTIIKRSYVKDLPKYSEELYDEDAVKYMEEREEHRRKAIEFRKELSDATDKEIENEISRLKELLTNRE